MYRGTRELCSLFALLALLLVTGGCNRNSGPDPANANLAPIDQSAYPAAPTEPYETSPPDSDQSAEALVPPPPLPDYQQPPCPGENYIWTPGYWSYGDAGYYWVPGAWILAPYIDALWTPPYWDYYGGRYRWHGGYWGRYIGFYGGIDYGFGYTGLGFNGGYWNRGAFVYNRAVTNVDPRIVANVYSRSVPNYTPLNRISYNGPGGVDRRPTAPELAVGPETRIAPLPAQIQHMREAAASRAQFAGENRGRPPVPALVRPLATTYRASAPPPPMWQSHAPRQEPPSVRERPEGAQGPPAVPARGEASRIQRPETRPAQPPAASQQPTPPMETRREMPPRGGFEQQSRPVQPTGRFAAPPHEEHRQAPPGSPPKLAQEAHPAPPAGRFAAPPHQEARPPAPPPAASKAAPQARPEGRGPHPEERKK